MIDYVTNRAFRCTLLVGPEAVVEEGMHAEALHGLCFAPHLQVAGKQKPGAAEGRFETERRTKVNLRSVPLVAFVRALAGRKGAFTPYKEVLVEAQRLAGKNFTEEEQTRLCEDLLTLYGRREVALAALPFSPPPQLPPRPRLTPLNFALSQKRCLVVSAAHDRIRLGTEEQAICALLDGTRTLAELRATTPSRSMEGNLETYLRRLLSLGCLQVG